MHVKSGQWRSSRRFVSTYSFSTATPQGFDIYKHFDRILTKNMMMLAECLPVKVKAAHVCTGSGKAVFELVNPVLKHMVGRVVRLQRIMHVSCCARGSLSRFISPKVFVLIILGIYHR
jgi:hypothetical protein